MAKSEKNQFGTISQWKIPKYGHSTFFLPDISAVTDRNAALLSVKQNNPLPIPKTTKTKHPSTHTKVKERSYLRYLKCFVVCSHYFR